MKTANTNWAGGAFLALAVLASPGMAAGAANTVEPKPTVAATANASPDALDAVISASPPVAAGWNIGYIQVNENDVAPFGVGVMVDTKVDPNCKVLCNKEQAVEVWTTYVRRRTKIPTAVVTRIEQDTRATGSIRVHFTYPLDQP